MLQFSCDWCGRLKDDGETWVLGFAAENIGVTAARREVTVVSAWDTDRAVAPLAVHFCSEEHKDDYIRALFEVKSGPANVVRMPPAGKRAPRKNGRSGGHKQRA